ncbi:MAG: tRNA-dihydrouridine synthase family protein [Planctomycetota bacterium]|nr:tRNA-dihydrouridine synthase family protein [Planctomycetota bacterium]
MNTINAMSVQLHPDYATNRDLPRSIEAIAQSFKLDPRIPALVPGFDAPFFQAGLAGYSDAPMRLIARQHGCPFTVTEALLDRTLINGGKGRAREDPDLLAEECGTGSLEENVPADHDESIALNDNGGKNKFRGGDHPIAGQIMGTFPDEMAKGAALLAKMNYDVIDVNFACPVKKVKKRNRGGHFLTAPDDAIDVLRAVREAVPAEIPTTVKMRRGWDDSPEMADNFERVFESAYELGYAWATVHCRTVEQRYLGPGRWEALTELVERHPDKLIFGSGDIWQVQDIFAMLELTGVKGIAVARGCIGNPWIFRQARQLMAGEHPEAPTLDEQRQVLLDHFDLSMKLHGEQPAARMMRKFGIKFAAHHPKGDDVRLEFIRCKTMEDWEGVIGRHYGP